MFIKDFFSKKRPVISFEIFPPKKDSSVDVIYKTLEELADEKPDFISVTYSAGGVGSEKTVEIASIIKNNFGIESLAHLTCITANSQKIRSTIEKLSVYDVENILALRGDLPENFKSEGQLEYRYASDLIREIKNHNKFCIGAAAYPEGHIDAEDLQSDLGNLMNKVNAGADFLVTQLFFDNRLFYDFDQKRRIRGIKVPVSVGIMPVLSKQQIQKMIFMCGVCLPSKIIRILNKYENDPESLKNAGIEYAAEQIDDLLQYGVEGIHIYTMNQPEIAKKILKHIRPSLLKIYNQD